METFVTCRRLVGIKSFDRTTCPCRWPRRNCFRINRVCTTAVRVAPNSADKLACTPIH